MGVNSFSFRDTASFGKRMKYNIIGKMLMEGKTWIMSSKEFNKECSTN